MVTARREKRVLGAAVMIATALVITTCAEHFPRLAGPPSENLDRAPSLAERAKAAAAQLGGTPHERYARQLARAYPAESPVVKRWQALAVTSLADAQLVQVPHQEVLYLDPTRAAAQAYIFELRRGQRVIVELPPGSTGTTLASSVFLDLYEQTSPAAQPRRVTSDFGRKLSHDVRRDGHYLLRIQPKLHGGGRFPVVVTAGPSLAFPVERHDARAVQSFFGSPRDGGRREHHGIDVFAPRGTLAVAAADAMVIRTGQSRLGGNIVWLREPRRNLALYYAHLDQAHVHVGQWVSAGDPIGAVGNTGNARHTQPHLHFGIYHRGPVDPYPYVHEPRERPPEVRVPTTDLGQPKRVRGKRVRLLNRPGGEMIRHVPSGEFVRPIAASARWYRVRLPDESNGYLSPRDLADPSIPLRVMTTQQRLPLRSRPTMEASVILEIASGQRVAVLATFEDHLWLEDTRGTRGWVAKVLLHHGS